MHIMQKLCRNYAKKIMQKLCKNYAKIMQKLCNVPGLHNNACIMQKLCKLCKNYANYASLEKLCKLCIPHFADVQVSKNMQKHLEGWDVLYSMVYTTLAI